MNRTENNIVSNKSIWLKWVVHVFVQRQMGSLKRLQEKNTKIQGGKLSLTFSLGKPKERKWKLKTEQTMKDNTNLNKWPNSCNFRYEQIRSYQQGFCLFRQFIIFVILSKKRKKSEGPAQTEAVAKLEFINRGHPFCCFLCASYQLGSDVRWFGGSLSFTMV